MKRFYFYILVSCLLSLTSCYRDFQYDREGLSPHIILHSFVQADSSIKVHVSKSWLIGDEPSDTVLEGAKVSLFVNDERRDVKRVIPQSGDRLRMVVEAEGLPTVEASTEVPERIPIKQVDYTIEPLEYDGHRIHMKIRFQDPPGERNYYGLGIYSQQKDIYYTSLDWKNEPVFAALSGSNILDDLLFSANDYKGRTYPFSDELIDGLEYTLSVSPSFYYYSYEENGYVPYTICLYTLSESYYKYLLSLAMLGVNRLSEYGMADPNRTYQNVTNGMGVLAACQVDTFVIYWRDDSKNR